MCTTVDDTSPPPPSSTTATRERKRRAMPSGTSPPPSGKRWRSIARIAPRELAVRKSVLPDEDGDGDADDDCCECAMAGIVARRAAVGNARRSIPRLFSAMLRGFKNSDNVPSSQPVVWNR